MTNTWGDFEKMNRLLFVAVILDPRYKLVAFDFWCRKNLSHEVGDNLVETLKGDIICLFDQYAGVRVNVDEVQS